MADVFISYSRATREATLDLTEGLMNQGYSVWTDRNLLADQRPFREVIDAAVDGAKAVVAIWSEPALKSAWVEYEANRAFKQNKLINARTHDIKHDRLPPTYYNLNSVPVSDIASIVNTLVAKGIQPEYGAGVPLPPEEALEREAIAAWRAGVSDTEDVEQLRAFLAKYDRARKVADVAKRQLESLIAIEAAKARDANSQAAIKLFAAIQDESDAETLEFFLKKHGGQTELALVAGRRLIELAPERVLTLDLPAPLLGLKDEAQAAIRRRNTKPEDAILRLDPGMHTAMIRRIAARADGRVLATGSEDKTVRLWALPEGRLIRTLRPPIGAGDEGKVNAVAMDPSGLWVAAGGWMKSGGNHFITLFDSETGRVRQRLGPLPNVVHHLAVSADGALLAAGLGGANGVRVWTTSPPPLAGASERSEIAPAARFPRRRPEELAEGSPGVGGVQAKTSWLDRILGRAPKPEEAPLPPTPGPSPASEEGEWRLLWQDNDYADAVYGLSFDATGRLAATSYDGHIRLYDPAGRRLKKVKAASGAQPFGVAFDAPAKRLAVGYSDRPCVDLLDAQTLAPLPPPDGPTPDLAGLSGGSLHSVAWTGDGRLAAGGTHKSSGRPLIVSWPDRAQGDRNLIDVEGGTIMDLAALPDGRLAFGTGDPAWGLLDAGGKRVLFKGPPGADLRGKVREHFTVSADGKRIRFGLGYGSETPILFDLAARRLEEAPVAPPGLAPADTQSLPVTRWEDGMNPALAGKALTLRANEAARALAIPPGGAGFALGAHLSLYRFDSAGAQIWRQDVPGVCWGVNFAREGKLIIAAYGGGTIRWHRWEDGEELLALYIHLPEGVAGPRRWILWTPAGYYDCSPGADDIIGWHVNRGEDEAADFYPAGTFAAAFKKPDKIDAALDGV